RGSLPALRGGLVHRGRQNFQFRLGLVLGRKRRDLPRCRRGIGGCGRRRRRRRGGDRRRHRARPRRRSRSGEDRRRPGRGGLFRFNRSGRHGGGLFRFEGIYVFALRRDDLNRGGLVAGGCRGAGRGGGGSGAFAAGQTGTATVAERAKLGRGGGGRFVRRGAALRGGRGLGGGSALGAGRDCFW